MSPCKLWLKGVSGLDKLQDLFAPSGSPSPANQTSEWSGRRPMKDEHRSLVTSTQ